jgi:hypothetical protein
MGEQFSQKTDLGVAGRLAHAVDARRTSLNGVLCGNETTATYEFQPEAVDYFRRGRRAMVRPRMEAIPVSSSFCYCARGSGP